MKVLHLITGLSTGGAEMMLYKLVSQMDRDKFDIYVISLTDIGPIGERIQSLGIPVNALGMKRGIPDPCMLVKLIRLLKKIFQILSRPGCIIPILWAAWRQNWPETSRLFGGFITAILIPREIKA